MSDSLTSSNTLDGIVKITASSFGEVLSVPIRELSIEGIGGVVTAARQKGWYGNLSLLESVVRTCVVVRPELLDKMARDVFLNASIAKEVWILALRRLARRTNHLAKGLGSLQVPKVHRYKSRDLATPGLLYFMREDLRNIDTDKFTRFVLDKHVQGLNGTKVLTKRQIHRFYKKVGYDEAAAWIMEVLGVEPKLFKSPQLRMLKGGDKVYATFLLATTLDLRQYFRQAIAYNQVLAFLLRESHQLAGMPKEALAPQLPTGIPLFASLVSAPESLPTEVCVALANDAQLERLNHLSRRYHTLVRDALAQAKEDARAALDRNKSLKERVRSMRFVLMKTFNQQISQSPGLMLDACIAYHDEFCRNLDRELREEVGLYQEASKLSSVPDCYILVEGASDSEYIQAAVELLGGLSANIRVEDCNGKTGIVRRFRDIVSKHSYIGSVVALFDSDAEKEFRDLAKILGSSKNLLAAKLRIGTIEDCFPLATQIRALNALYPGGERLRVTDASNDRLREAILKSLVWGKKRAAFDKVALAKEVRRRLKRHTDLPDEIIQFVKRAIQLANQRARLRKFADERFAVEEGAGFSDWLTNETKAS